MSNRYQLTGALDKMDAARNSEILFYRETELPPGRYTFEAAVHDALAGTTSVRAGSVEVPDADETKLRLSSVAIVKRGEQLKAADKNPNNPFQIGEALLYPNLGEPLRKAATKQMAFFFTAYLPKGDTAAPKMLLEIMAAAAHSRSFRLTSPPRTPRGACNMRAPCRSINSRRANTT